MKKVIDREPNINIIIITMNPVKKIKLNKNLSIYKLAKLIDSNNSTITKVEQGNCLETTYLTIIRKISLQFEDIDNRKLLRNYKKYMYGRE